MTLGDVGIFGVAYRFAAIVTLVMSGFQTALIPLIYQNYKNIETPKEVSKIFNYFLVIMLFCIMGLSLFSHEILVIFTTPSYYKAAEIIPIISFATLFLTLYIFTPGLSIAKKTKTSTAIYICSALLNTGLNFTLIPIWGIMGAGLSTLFSGIALFAANVYFSQKNFYIPYNWKKIITAFISSAIIILLAILFEYLNIINKNIMAVIKLVMLIFTEWFIIRVVIGNQKFFVLINEIKKIIIAKSQKVLK